MIDAIRTAASAMFADMERLRATSQNLSSTATNGYKAQIPVSRSVVTVSGDFAAQLAAPAALTLTQDMRPGVLSQTQRTLDFAVEGAGYFRLETPAGTRWTREGSFHLDGNGELVSKDGFPVYGEGGALQLDGDDVTVDRNGVMSRDGKAVGRLSVYALDMPDQLVYEGNGLYSASLDSGRELGIAEAGVRQGYLEASNVEPLQEMSRMMETMRHFQLLSRALRASDAMLDVGINDFGRT